jgi:hypothetical protein
VFVQEATMRVHLFPGRTSAAVFAVLALTFVVPKIEAQNIFGRISGTVTDSSGAVVADVKVTIINEETKLTRALVTNDSGFYVAPDMPAGSYSVAAERAGFQTSTKTGNDLVAGARLTVDLSLKVGAEAQHIEVVATGETVNTTSGEISRTVDSQQVQNLALNERNYGQLVSLMPGAALTTFDQTALTTGMSTTGSSVNGLRADGNLFTVDGGFNMDSGSNATQLDNVGIDFIREVSVETSNYSAEYGRNDASTVNVVTKSGGNAFHGGAFEFVRNNTFDAVNVASKLNAAPGTPLKVLKPALRYNDFGWDLGGPIKRGKLFFFAGEEWKRIRISQSPANLTGPTSQELAGNFSGVSGLTLKTPPNAPSGCTIVNNVMSPQCITADGQAIANVYKLMETKVASAFADTNSANNVLFQPYNPQNWREDIIRLDYQASIKQSIYFRYLHDSLNLIDAFGTFSGPNGNGTNVLPTDPTNRIRPGYSYQLGHLWTISPHLINEARFNVSWNKQRIPPIGDTWERSTYGFQFPLPFPNAGLFPNGIPILQFTGIGSGSLSTAAPTQATGPSFSLLAPTTDISPSENFTWQKANHTLKFGVIYARNRKDQNSRPGGGVNGNITFATNGNPNSTGDPFADALMGNFQIFTQSSADPVGHFRFNDTEAYVNDSWKVTRKFSVELGLRYVRTGPTYTQANNMVNFDPSLYNPAQAPIVSAANIPTCPASFPNCLDPNPAPNGVGGYVINGLVRPGNVPPDQVSRVPGATSAFVLAVPATAPRGFYKPENLFAPRVGFALLPFKDDRTVIRGGFGIFYDKPEGNIILGQPGIQPFSQAVQYQNGNLSNPAGGAGATPTITSQISAVDPNFVVARVMQYSLSVQHELPYGVLLETAYVGNLGRHEVRQPNINVPSFATAAADAGATTNQERPYLGYTNILQFQSDSNSNYNALQIYATKRKGDLTATVSYTYSKALGQTSGINDNPEPECPFTCTTPTGQLISWNQFYNGPVSFDRRNIFVATYSYDSPFFRNLRGIGGAVLSGWRLSGATRAQSGQPFTVMGSQTIGAAGKGVTAFTRRANIVPGVPLYSGYTCPAGKVCWFNPAAFAAPPVNGIGNAPTGDLVGPGYYAWDLSLRKSFRLPREGMSLMFQADAFNIFNRTNWGTPGTPNVTGGGFGQIGSSNPPRNLQFGAKFAF